MNLIEKLNKYDAPVRGNLVERLNRFVDQAILEGNIVSAQNIKSGKCYLACVTPIKWDKDSANSWFDRLNSLLETNFDGDFFIGFMHGVDNHVSENLNLVHSKHYQDGLKFGAEFLAQRAKHDTRTVP